MLDIKKYKNIIPALAIVLVIISLLSFSNSDRISQLGQAIQIEGKTDIGVIKIKNGGQKNAIELYSLKFKDHGSIDFESVELYNLLNNNPIGTYHLNDGTILIDIIKLLPQEEISIVFKMPSSKLPSHDSVLNIQELYYMYQDSNNISQNQTVKSNANLFIPKKKSYEQPNFSIVLDESSPKFKLVEGGTLNSLVAVLRVRGSDEEDIQLNSLSLQLSDTDFNSPNDFNGLARIFISGKSEPVGATIFIEGDKTFATLNNVKIPKNESISLEIRVDVGSIGPAHPTKIGNIIKIDWDADSEFATFGYGLNSGDLIRFTGQDTKSEGIQIAYKGSIVNENTNFKLPGDSNLSSPESPSLLSVDLPDKPDINVLYISRTPKYERYNVKYNNSGIPIGIHNENSKHYVEDGEEVTFTAFIANNGGVSINSFDYQWIIDDHIVDSGTYSSPLLSRGKTFFEYRWTWIDKGNHKVEFKVDPTNNIEEIEESNNSISNNINDYSFRIHVGNDVYDGFNSRPNLIGSYSFEDWVQANAKEMNYRLKKAGALRGIRIDSVIIEPSGYNPSTGEHIPNNFSQDLLWDGRWGFEREEWTDDKIETWIDETEQGLIHEWAHQIGIIDNYNLNFDSQYVNNNEIVPNCDKNQNSIVLEDKKCSYYARHISGIMLGNTPDFSEFDILGLNSSYDKRRGYFGDYLFDLPRISKIKLLKNDNSTLSGAEVKVYQGSNTNIRKSDLISTSSSDSSGLITLPNRDTGNIPETKTNHTLKPNPFGLINVAGKNGLLLLEINKDGNTDYQFTDISRFNIEYWKGNTETAIVEIKTNL